MELAGAVWVVGASGQIGGPLAQQLAAEGEKVIAFSRAVQSPVPWANWIRWDGFSDLDDREVPRPDQVFYLGAPLSVPTNYSEAISESQAGIVGFLQVLRAACLGGNVPDVILAGTATEVGLGAGAVVHDALVDDPPTAYDVLKVAQRHYLSVYSTSGLLKGVTLRFSNVYGGKQSDAPGRGFLNKAIVDALSGRSLRYVADGRMIRDYLFVDDAVSALLAARQVCRRDAPSFLIGSGQGTEIRTALELVSEVVSTFTSNRVAVVPRGDGFEPSSLELRNAVVDSSRFTRATGWTARTPLRDGIELVVRRSLLPASEG
jgi:UDP-glucose 4-epimerase